MKEIDVKKSVGLDTIPPKFIKFEADIISKSLMLTINCCLHVGIFPDNANIASVVSLGKEKPNKHDVLSYRHVSIF